MPRPRTYSDEIWLRVYDLIRSNPRWGHGRVTEELRKSLGKDTPSDRTVSRIMREVSRSEQRLSEAEEPWRAWEEPDPELTSAVPYLLRIAGGVQSLELFRSTSVHEAHIMGELWDFDLQADPSTDSGAKVPELSRLEARWVWRVHTAAPELTDHDVYWTAQDIVSRHRVHAVLSPGQSFDHSDIHFLLALKPWSSESRYRRYLHLVRSNRVPPYRITPLADVTAAQPSVPLSARFRESAHAQGTLQLPIRGDYSLISPFVERQCRGLDLIRRRALRNDFGFEKSWKGRTRPRLSSVTRAGSTSTSNPVMRE